MQKENEELQLIRRAVSEIAVLSKLQGYHHVVIVKTNDKKVVISIDGSMFRIADFLSDMQEASLDSPIKELNRDTARFQLLMDLIYLRTNKSLWITRIKVCLKRWKTFLFT